MCVGDDHLAWKHPVSFETCKGLHTTGRTLSLYVGASEGFQSLYGHSLDSILPLFGLPFESAQRLEFSSHICSHLHSGHIYDSRVLIIHPDFGSPPQDHFKSWSSLESPSWRRVRGRLIRADSHQCSDNSVEMSDELTATLASIQEFMAGAMPHGVSLGTPFHLADHYETTPPLTAIVSPPMDEGLTWDDRDGIPTVSLPAKFRMPDIERYSGVSCPKIHLRLYSTVMRAQGIDDAQLVALFPMSLSRAAQRCLLSMPILMYPDESWRPSDRGQTSLFLHLSLIWRAKVAGMIDRPKERDQIDMVLRNLQPRFARHLVGIQFQDLRSLVHAAFSVEEAIAQGLWTYIATSLDSKGKKPIGSPSRFGEEPYIAQTSMHPRPPHPRATTYPLPRPYAQRPARQFIPLGMTLTRAFEKLRDAGLIVPLVPHPLPHSIPPHFPLT
ncbi:hypothetical protein CK203_054414 [Vitis vinifera]|uniref:Uncharacterized protein n=1 Tax=Vitis vinifera TaxID=29760 RepID=A0A438GG56_VITVI|nr:hypothetical protein CK203_054414 [Vitis vinifera]